MKISLLSAVILFAFAFAKEGDRCTYAGLTGVCKKVAACTMGFTETGACPNDPADVKCCMSKDCSSPDTGTQGVCLDSSSVPCDNGGTFITGQCPGDEAVQCCINEPSRPRPSPAPGPPVTTPASKPKPSATAIDTPSCKAVSISESWGTTTFILNRSVTKGITTPAGYLGTLGGVCATIAGASAGTLALLCGIAGGELWALNIKAGECTGKNQCIKLVYYPFVTLGVPFCIGTEDGCC